MGSLLFYHELLYAPSRGLACCWWKKQKESLGKNMDLGKSQLYQVTRETWFVTHPFTLGTTLRFDLLPLRDYFVQIGPGWQVRGTYVQLLGNVREQLAGWVLLEALCSPEQRPVRILCLSDLGSLWSSTLVLCASCCVRKCEWWRPSCWFRVIEGRM